MGTFLIWLGALGSFVGYLGWAVISILFNWGQLFGPAIVGALVPILEPSRTSGLGFGWEVDSCPCLWAKGGLGTLYWVNLI